LLERRKCLFGGIKVAGLQRLSELLKVIFDLSEFRLRVACLVNSGVREYSGYCHKDLLNQNMLSLPPVTVFAALVGSKPHASAGIPNRCGQYPD
jgi:hypothetical protein